MTVHSAHGDVHAHGLADGCERCHEQAQRPFENLDRGVLADLLVRVRSKEVGRSVNEQIAMDVIRDVLWRSEILASLEREAIT